MIINPMIFSFSYLFSAFFFWKQLKEDYIQSQIFSSYSLFIVLLIILAMLEKFMHFGGVGVYSLFVCIFLFYAAKKGIKVREAFEAFIPTIILPVLLISFKDLIFDTNVKNILAIVLSVLCNALYFYLHSNYKLLRWYRSGRIGVASVLSTVVFCLSLVILKYFQIDFFPYIKNNVDLFILFTIIIFSTFSFIRISRIPRLNRG